MICIDFVRIYQEWNLDWPNVIMSGLVGLGLVLFVDWFKKPKIKFIGFQKINVNFGVLYKILIKIDGYVHPGLSRIDISWRGGSVFANWDENPNPLKNDCFDNFVPELVPQTFFQNTFCGKIYSVPILHEESDESKKITVFSGWWFGRNKGYKESVPELVDDSEIQIEFLSQNVSKKSKKYTVRDIKIFLGKI